MFNFDIKKLWHEKPKLLIRSYLGNKSLKDINHNNDDEIKLYFSLTPLTFYSIHCLKKCKNL